jgi:hypothetical protein
MGGIFKGPFVTYLVEILKDIVIKVLKPLNLFPYPLEYGGLLGSGATISADPRDKIHAIFGMHAD